MSARDGVWLGLELQHLADAERHIREGTERVEQMRKLIRQGRALGINVQHAVRALKTMRSVLLSMTDHRDAIAARVNELQKLALRQAESEPEPAPAAKKRAK